MGIDEITQSVVPLAAGGLGIPVLLWRIYRWIDVRTRAQIEGLEKRLAACELLVEQLRQQRITEVDQERTARIAAQDQGASDHASVVSLTEQIRMLGQQNDDLRQRLAAIQ